MRPTNLLSPSITTTHTSLPRYNPTVTRVVLFANDAAKDQREGRKSRGRYALRACLDRDGTSFFLIMHVGGLEQKTRGPPPTNTNTTTNSNAASSSLLDHLKAKAFFGDFNKKELSVFLAEGLQGKVRTYVGAWAYIPPYIHLSHLWQQTNKRSWHVSLHPNIYTTHKQHKPNQK